MRQIGTLPSNEAARTFEDFLLTRGVKASVEESGSGWAVWIYDEDDVEQARQELSDFRENPDDERFTKGAQAAGELRRQEEKQRKQAAKNLVHMRERWNRPMTARAPVTSALIAISIVVAAAGTDWGRFSETLELCNQRDSIVGYLYIQSWSETGGGWIRDDPYFGDVRRGQIWRLVTPIFIHLGPLHILFNMLWLLQLGSAIELRRGTLRYAGIVLAMVVLSNAAQYLYKGPLFGGMSGVVFGLFGYIWIKSRYEPESGFLMPPNVAFLMIVWFVVCFTGYVGPIANTAHGVGLMTGMVIGYWPTFRRKLAGR